MSMNGLIDNALLHSFIYNGYTSTGMAASVYDSEGTNMYDEATPKKHTLHIEFTTPFWTLESDCLYKIGDSNAYIYAISIPIELDDVLCCYIRTEPFFDDIMVPSESQFAGYLSAMGIVDDTKELYRQIPHFTRQAIDNAIAIYRFAAQAISKCMAQSAIYQQISSELSATRAKLEEVSHHLQDVQEIAKVDRWELDLSTFMTYWDLGIYNLCEKDPAAFVPTYESYLQMVHPEDQKRFNDAFEEALISLQPHEMEHRLVMSDGRVKWVIETGRTVYDQLGNAVKMVGFVQDITEHKMHHQAVDESETQFRKLLDTITSAAVQGYTSDGEVIYWNKASERLFGYSADEAINKSIYELTLTEDVKSDHERLLRELITSEVIPDLTEYELLKKDGSRVTVLSNYMLLKLPGRDAQIYRIDVDITDRKLAEQVQNFMARTSSPDDELFFENIVKQIHDSFGFSYVSIDRICEDGVHAERIASYAAEGVELQKTYCIAGSPAEMVLRNSTYHCSGGIHSLFPDDTMLQSVDAENFLGVVAWNYQGQPIGIVSIANSAILPNRVYVQPTLKVVAVRVAGEIERIQAEKAIIASEKQYRLLAHNIADVICICDIDERKYTYISPSVVTMLGYSVEYLVANGFGAIMSPLIKNHAVELVNMRLPVDNQAQQQLYVDEIPLTSQSGDVVWAEFSSRFTRNTQSGHTEIICLIRDITKRKQTQMALVNSERNYREIFNATADTMIIRDPETWQVLDVNNSMLRMFGYETKEEAFSLIPGALSANLPYYTHEDASKYIELAIHGESPVFEWLSRRKSGELFWSEIAMHGSDVGGNARVIVTIRDISERKRMADALRESEQSLRRLVESLPDVIFRLDRNMTFLFVSNNVIDTFNVMPSQLIGQPFDQSGLFADIYELMRNSVSKVFETGIQQSTTSIVRDSSKYLVYSHRFVPEYDAQGNIVSVLSLNRDITALRRAEEDYQNLFLQMHAGMAVHELLCDEKGKPIDYRFLAVNPMFEKIMGMTSEQIIGHTVLELFPQTEKYWIEHYGQVVLTGVPATFEDYSKELQRYFEVTAFRSAPMQFACIVTDVTDRRTADSEKKKLQETLQQALKMESIGRLAGGVAHDFNNMLGVILGHAQMALETVSPDEPLYDDLSEIHSAATRSADLTRQLLAFARKQTVVPKLLDLNNTIESMLKMLQRMIGENISLRWIPGTSIWPVKIDPTQIDQILANLCINARDAIKDIGMITIRTGTTTINDHNVEKYRDGVPGDYVWFSVEDNGAGINIDQIDLIFEPFYTTKGVGEGTGLGLATVYGAVKQNNGFIEVRSEPEVGTTFTIFLARHMDAELHTEAVAEGQTVEHGTETILLVEDEPAILRMTQRMMQRLGYQVVAAGSPREAISIAEKTTDKLDILVTDVVMPDMNGQDLAIRIKELIPSIKCVFVSGYTSDIISTHGLLNENVVFLQKPFVLADLGKTLRIALDGE